MVYSPGDCRACQSASIEARWYAATDFAEQTVYIARRRLQAALAQNPNLSSSIVQGSAGMNDPATESIAASEYLLQGAQYLQANGVDDTTVLDVRGYYNFGPGGMAI